MISIDTIAAARVFGRVEVSEQEAVFLQLDHHVARAWDPENRSSAWASIRSAVRRFARQALVSSACPQVVIREGSTTLSIVTARSQDGES